MIQIYIIHHIFCVNLRAPLYTILYYALLCYLWKLHGITMKHLWIAYEYDHVSPILQARSARTAEPAFLPLGEDIPGQSGRDMPREDPLKRFKRQQSAEYQERSKMFYDVFISYLKFVRVLPKSFKQNSELNLERFTRTVFKGTYCRLHTAAWCQSELEHWSLELGWWVA